MASFCSSSSVPSLKLAIKCNLSSFSFSPKSVTSFNTFLLYSTLPILAKICSEGFAVLILMVILLIIAESLVTLFSSSLYSGFACAKSLSAWEISCFLVIIYFSEVELRFSTKSLVFPLYEPSIFAPSGIFKFGSK